MNKTKINCTIYSCGRNIGGECPLDEITISWEGVCDNKMIAGEDDKTKYYKYLENENNDLRHENRDLERNADNSDISFDLDGLADSVDKIKENLIFSLERLKDTVDDLRANF